MMKQLATLEARLEGFFSLLLGRQNEARQVLRAISQTLEDVLEGQSTLPAHLTLHLHPDDHHLLSNQAGFRAHLQDYIADYAVLRGLAVLNPPGVQLLPSAMLERYSVEIIAEKPDTSTHSTQRMVSNPPRRDAPPADAHLLREGRLLARLERHVVNIGRDKGNQIILDDPRVSRQHCQIRLRHGCYEVFDLDSTHGTWVNGARVTRCVLHYGDVISLGGVQLVYLQEESTDAQPDYPAEDWTDEEAERWSSDETLL